GGAAMPLEEQLLTASLTDTFHAVRPILEKLYEFAPRSMEEIDEPSDEVNELDELLLYYVEKAFRDGGILAERLGLPILAQQIVKARSKIEHLDNTNVLPD